MHISCVCYFSQAKAITGGPCSFWPASGRMVQNSLRFAHTSHAQTHTHKAPQGSTCVAQHATVCTHLNTSTESGLRESSGATYSNKGSIHSKYTCIHVDEQCAGNCWKLHVSSCNLYLSGPVDLNLSPAEHSTCTC